MTELKLISKAKQTFNLYNDGVITKDNALINLREYYSKAGDLDEMGRIAEMIRFVEMGL